MELPEVSFARERILEQVKSIVLSSFHLMSVKVYLFGSWARKEEKKTSDIDIGVWYNNSLPNGTLMQLRSILEESTIPYRIDLVDLTKADLLLLEKVRKEGIVWKD